MANMKICKHCKAEVAKNAKTCPKCGGQLGMPTWAKVIIILGVILFMLGGCVVGCTGLLGAAVDDAVQESFGGYDDQNGKTSFNVGETFESKHMRVTFDSSNTNFTNYSEYATVKEGYKVVQFKFTAENIGEENQTFDYTDFNCYADDETMQQFYSVEDSGLDAGGTVSSGKKVSVPVYCEVPAGATKIYVEYKPLLAEKNYEFIAG